jgi:hypothetical protein
MERRVIAICGDIFRQDPTVRTVQRQDFKRGFRLRLEKLLLDSFERSLKGLHGRSHQLLVVVCMLTVDESRLRVYTDPGH